MAMSPKSKALGLYLGVCSATICLAFAALASFAAPYLVARDFFQAALRQDGEAMAVLIDFPALRDNLRPQIRKVVSEHAGEIDSSSAVLASAFAGFFVDPIVDLFVTPSGLKLGLQKIAEHGNRPINTDKHWVLEKLNNELPNLPARASKLQGKLTDLAQVAGYQSFNEFRVVCKVDRTIPLKLTFKREGWFNWKLSNIAVAEFVDDLYAQRLAERKTLQPL